MILSEGMILHNGRYTVIRFLGQGGFGCTYEAVENNIFKERVAIKEFFVKDYCNRDSDGMYVTVGTQSKKTLVERLKKKFMDEALVLHGIEHDGIVRVTDYFEENGTAYYVMKYIGGKRAAVQILHNVIRRVVLLEDVMNLYYIAMVQTSYVLCLLNELFPELAYKFLAAARSHRYC